MLQNLKSKIQNPPLFPLALTLFLWPVLHFLLRGDGLPCTHDNAAHAYRIVALLDAWKNGWLFSRWLPNLALGYGCPLLQFAQPLPYLLGALFHGIGLSLPLVLGLLYWIGFLAAGWGAYTLARDLWGEPGAWVTGMAYALGPFLLLNALRRGSLPESLALALLPWLLWAFRRLILAGGHRRFALTVALLTALFLTHNITTLLFAPFLGGYVLLLAWIHRERRTWLWAFVAVALALMLTAWFWLPALAEQDFVQLHLAHTTRNNDFRYNFVAWAELLSLPASPRPDLLNPPMRITAGLPQTLLALLGLILGLRRLRHDGERRATLIYLAGCALLYLWLATPASRGVWETVPQLAFVQFPWRLAGRALLPLALLAGVAFPSPSAIRHSPFAIRHAPFTIRHSPFAIRHSLILLLLALLALFAWPEMTPSKGFCPQASRPTLEQLYAFEQAGWFCVDNEGSFTPVWVQQRPTSLTLAQTFIAGTQPERLDSASLPPGAHVSTADYRPLRAALTLETPEAFTARWLVLYYPGWRVQVDGAQVNPAPEPATGFLTFSVPAGRHTITVTYGETPLRRAANGISWVGVCLTVAVFLVRGKWRMAKSEWRMANGELEEIQNPKSKIQNLTVLLLALLLLPAKTLLYDRLPAPAGMPHLARIDTGLPVAPTPLAQRFDAGLMLTGYTLYAATLPADAEIGTDLWWRVETPPSSEYRTTVQLVGADGQSWSGAGTHRPRGYEPPPATPHWPPGSLVYDPHLVAPLPGTPPGKYRVVVSLFERDTLNPASALGADGNLLGPTLTLGTLTVTRPTSPSTLAALGVPEDTTPVACGALQLWAFTTDRTQAAPGEIVGLRWVWEALDDPGEALTVTLSLYAASPLIGGTEGGRTWDLPPAAVWWPTEQWQAGDRWIGRPVLRLPGGLESGDYTLELALPPETVEGVWVRQAHPPAPELVEGIPGCAALARVPLTIIAPERVWELPAGLTLLEDAIFGEQARLAGYALEWGDELRVTLAWQAVAEMTGSYRVFAHLVDSEGRVVAQSDGEPVAWTRPTTGWAVGEVVTETRFLPISAPGAYTLRVGLYLPDGPRLTLPDGADAIKISLDSRQ